MLAMTQPRAKTTPESTGGSYTSKNQSAPERSLPGRVTIIEQSSHIEDGREYNHQKYSDGSETHFVIDINRGYVVTHREDGPAITRADGTEEWHRWGTLHRDGGLPAISGPHGEEYYIDGKLHREGGLPAVQYTTPEGVSVEGYYINDELHREGGLPAYTRTAGEVVETEYCVSGVHHREGNLPARTDFDEETGDLLETYLVDGKLHRTDGPARLSLNDATGRFDIPSFWLRGEKLDEATYRERVKAL